MLVSGVALSSVRELDAPVGGRWAKCSKRNKKGRSRQYTLRSRGYMVQGLRFGASGRQSFLHHGKGVRGVQGLGRGMGSSRV